jgi:hypothetical protein
VLWKPPIYSVALTCSPQCTGLRNDTLVCAGTPHILRRRIRESGAGQLGVTALRKQDTPYTWPSSNSMSLGGGDPHGRQVPSRCTAAERHNHPHNPGSRGCGSAWRISLESTWYQAHRGMRALTGLAVTLFNSLTRGPQESLGQRSKRLFCPRRDVYVACGSYSQ